ncbi:hypothetical protein Slala02_74440 [Streptomyces lavendulae subsp. lavendulae]|nr:hypothetical protein Slala01_74060 [Streptomyces lavendulae subsp. lavendulae]GLX31625.1 hypothetical protein Slala02_74440 [Streptomyces lavendulae subsp. lavendulae]
MTVVLPASTWARMPRFRTAAVVLLLLLRMARAFRCLGWEEGGAIPGTRADHPAAGPAGFRLQGCVTGVR